MAKRMREYTKMLRNRLARDRAARREGGLPWVLQGVDVQQKRALDGGGQDIEDGAGPLVRVERIWRCCSRRRTVPIDAGVRSPDDWSMFNAGAGDGSIAAERAAEGSAVPLRGEMAGDPYRHVCFPGAEDEAFRQALHA